MKQEPEKKKIKEIADEALENVSGGEKESDSVGEPIKPFKQVFYEDALIGTSSPTY